MTWAKSQLHNKSKSNMIKDQHVQVQGGLHKTGTRRLKDVRVITIRTYNYRVCKAFLLNSMMNLNQSALNKYKVNMLNIRVLKTRVLLAIE